MLYLVIVIYAVISTSLGVTYEAKVEPYVNRADAVSYLSRQQVRAENPISNGIVVYKIQRAYLDSLQSNEQALTLQAMPQRSLTGYKSGRMRDSVQLETIRTHVRGVRVRGKR